MSPPIQPKCPEELCALRGLEAELEAGLEAGGAELGPRGWQL